MSVSLIATTTSFAFDEFKEALEQRYRMKSVSCKACHTDNKDKKIRNAFGKLLHEQLKDKNISEKYQEAKSEGEKTEEKFEKQMVKDFLIALKAVEKKPVTFLSLLEAGLLNGTRLDNKQVDVDAITIETPDEAELPESKVDNDNVIKGEIRKMPPEEDRPLPKKMEAPADSSKSKNASDTKPNPPKSDDAKPAINPEPPAQAPDTPEAE